MSPRTFLSNLIVFVCFAQLSACSCSRVVTVFAATDAGVDASPVDASREEFGPADSDMVDGGGGTHAWLQTSGQGGITSLEAMEFEGDLDNNWYVLLAFHGVLQIGASEYDMPEGGVILASYDTHLAPRWSRELPALRAYAARQRISPYVNLDRSWNLDLRDNRWLIVRHSDDTGTSAIFDTEGNIIPVSGAVARRVASAARLTSQTFCDTPQRCTTATLGNRTHTANAWTQNASGDYLLARVGTLAEESLAFVRAGAPNTDVTRTDIDLRLRRIEAIDSIADDFLVVSSERTNTALAPDVTNFLLVTRYTAAGSPVWERSFYVDFASPNLEVSINVSPNDAFIGVAGHFNGRAIVVGREAISRGQQQPLFFVLQANGENYLDIGSRGTTDLQPNYAGMALGIGVRGDGHPIVGGWAEGEQGTVLLGNRSAPGPGGFLWHYAGFSPLDESVLSLPSNVYAETHALATHADLIWSVQSIGGPLRRTLRIAQFNKDGTHVFTRDYANHVVRADAVDRTLIAVTDQDGSLIVATDRMIAKYATDGDEEWQTELNAEILDIDFDDARNAYLALRGGTTITLNDATVATNSAGTDFAVLAINHHGGLLWARYVPLNTFPARGVYATASGIHFIFRHHEPDTYAQTILHDAATGPNQVIDMILNPASGSFEDARLVRDWSFSTTYTDEISGVNSSGTPALTFMHHGIRWGLFRNNQYVFARLDQYPIVETTNVPCTRDVPPANVVIRAVSALENGMIAVAGRWSQPSILPGLDAPAGSDDGFLCILNSDFSLHTIERLGGGGFDDAVALAGYRPNEIYIGGTFEGFLSLRSFTARGVGARDSFVARIAVPGATP